MKQLLSLAVLLVGLQCASFADTVLPGTDLEVRSEGPITVSQLDKGRIFSARIGRDVMSRDGDIAIPRGARVELIIRQIGDDRLVLDIESLTVNGRRYAVDSSGPQFNMPRDQYDRGAGLVGNIIGAVTGAEPEGRAVHVPAGTDLHFRLRQPLRIVEWQDPGYDQNGNHYHREHDWYR